MPSPACLPPAFRALSLVCIFLASATQLRGQADPPPSPPVPIELLAGHERLFFQALISKPFRPAGRLGYFGIVAFHADYDNSGSGNEIASPFQISYNAWKGFGAFAGLAMSSKAGMHPIVGPQFVRSGKKYLVVVNGRYLLTPDHNFEGFALLEFRPPISEKWTLYTRLQALYSYNPQSEAHDRSFLYLRAGLRTGNFTFGPGANLDQYGPARSLKENYGLFARWEFH